MIDPTKPTIIHEIIGKRSGARVYIQKDVVVLSRSVLTNADADWEVDIETLRKIIKSHDSWFEKI